VLHRPVEPAKYVTVIIDLTPVRDGTGPARLLDMVEGRSKKAFKDWLADREATWRQGVDVVAMDGFTGFKTATTEELPDAVTVMDPFHVVRLAADALDECRRRVQLDTRGRTGDPLYRARRTLHTGADLLTDKQRTRIEKLFAVGKHVAVETTWGVYQAMIASYREPDRARARQQMNDVIQVLADAVPAGLTKLAQLGATLNRRADDVLAYFDRPHTSNGPTEAINGRLDTSAAPPSASATSPTTSPDHYSGPEGSGRDYTLDCEEPVSALERSPAPTGRGGQMTSPARSSGPSLFSRGRGTLPQLPCRLSWGWRMNRPRSMLLTATMPFCLKYG
jgi:hypothetical protein